MSEFRVGEVVYLPDIKKKATLVKRLIRSGYWKVIEHSLSKRDLKCHESYMRKI